MSLNEKEIFELCMPEKDRQMFRKYLDNATYYFEYGSGGSTIEAVKRKNIARIYSVENDPDWHNKISSKVAELETSNSIEQRVMLYHAKMPVRKCYWGYPTSKASVEDKARYSNYLSALGVDEAAKIDLILIDGRFRVACALKAFKYMGPNARIALDDFYPRKNKYGVLLNFYDIVEDSPSKRMVILQKRDDVNEPSQKLISRYEIISQ